MLKQKARPRSMFQLFASTETRFHLVQHVADLENPLAPCLGEIPRRKQRGNVRRRI